MRFRRPRGTQDILPQNSAQWEFIVRSMYATLKQYGYCEIRTPIFEDTQLFIRGVGEGTDIVQKEMYTFEDRKGRSLSLRPEGTAAVVRAYLENNMGREAAVTRLFYLGPMYRYDRPQAGRYREFFQVGAEAIGNEQPEQDVEIIDLMMSMFRDLGLNDLTVEINSVGSPDSRQQYEEVLRRELAQHQNELCSTCVRRHEKNPLRVLDCKNERCRKLVSKLPKLSEYLSPEDRDYDHCVRAGLDHLGVAYKQNDLLVRGLDYYTRTAFEVHYPPLGAQSALGGGGRYDGLIEACGGSATPAVGFSCGLERVLFALQETQAERLPGRPDPSIVIMPLGDAARRQALVLAGSLRSRYSTAVDLTGRSLKAQMRSVGKTTTRLAVILGDDELAQRTVRVKNLATSEQSNCGWDDLMNGVQQILNACQSEVS